MITIEGIDKKYYIPNNLSELTVSQYQEILQLPKDIDKYQRMLLILGELSGIPEKDIKLMPGRDIAQIVNNIFLMLQAKDRFLIDEFDLKGQKYKFESKIDNIRFDQFIDLVEMTENDDLIVKNLHIICAILYREAEITGKEPFKLKYFLKGNRKEIYTIKEYNSDELMDRAEIFKDLTMDIVFGMLFFFSSLKVIYFQRLADYSNQMNQKIDQE